MNTTSLTATRTTADQAAVVRVRVRRVRQRVSVRVGLALVAWGRRADARRTPEAVALRRANEITAERLREDNFAQVALRSRSSL